MVENESEMIKKMTIDMDCSKYDMACLDVPYEVLDYIGGLGFSSYTCNLDCRNCKHLE